MFVGKQLPAFPLPKPITLSCVAAYVHIPQQASFWRAELWQQVDLDPSFYFAMDYDLWTRLAYSAAEVPAWRTLAPSDCMAGQKPGCGRPLLAGNAAGTLPRWR